MNFCLSTRSSALGLALGLLTSVAASQPATNARSATPDWSKAATKQTAASQAFGSQSSGVTAPPASLRPSKPSALQAAPPKFGVRAEGSAGPARKLSDLDDRAIIIVGGKQTTAAELKKTIRADIARAAGPPKTVQGGARKLDLVALNTAGSAAAGVRAAPQKTLGDGFGGKPLPQQPSQGTAALTNRPVAALAPSTSVKQGITSGNGVPSLTENKCLDKGPPTITEVAGRLRSGAKVAVWGRCFGERPGRVELIGQFPGGKLALPFTAWDNTGIELEIPATVRGAADHVVAVTVVTADGKTSPAMQAQFVAYRERIEVPARLWSPTAGFERFATAETANLIGPTEVNQAYAGSSAMTLRVQPQCALDTMDAVVHSGAIKQIRGWEQGAPNEASVTVDWVGTCTSTRTTTNYNYVVAQGAPDISIHSACRVAFQTRAWAYCPVGVAP